MKKTIFALWQADKKHLFAKKFAFRWPPQVLCASIITLMLLFASGRVHGQCDDAIPCVSNINEYKCIVTGTASNLMGTQLLSYFQAGFQAQKIIVKSQLQFDVPYRFFEGSEIILLPGAKLYIGSDFVTLGNVTIRGCGDRWSEIRVFSNGTFTFEGGEINGGDIAIKVLGGTVNLSGAVIKNSCIGVDLTSGSKAKILGNHFLDNFYGVRVTGSTTTVGEGISHNTFEIVSGDPTNCTSLTNRHAIFLVNVPFIAIGNQDQTGLPNTIKNYTFGLAANNSNFNLYNTVFRDKLTGSAIELNGIGGTFNANIFGLGSSESSVPLIENYEQGVSSINYNLTIQNALFKSGARHIRLLPQNNVTTLPVSLNLTNNRLERFGQNAIICAEAKFNQATIQNNTILDNLDDVMIGQIRYGIRWQNNTMTGLNHGQIVNNTIKDVLKTSSTGSSEYWRHYGIQVSQSTKVNVELNVLSQDYQHSQPGDTRSYEGIGLFSSPFNEVRSNQITSGGPSMPDFFINNGVYVSESGNNLISCNNVAGFFNGFNFNGPLCDKTQFKQNTIQGDNLNGLNLTSGTIIGQQLKKDNVWPGNGSTEAIFDGNPTFGEIIASQFEISTPNINSALWANPRIPNAGWFVPPMTPPTPNPPTDLCYLDPDSPKSGADEQAITGGFQAHKDYPASLWEAQLKAFRTLSDYPEFLITGSADLQFYNAHDAGSVGKLSRSISAWEDIAQFSALFESAWNGNQVSITQKIEEIKGKVLEMSQAETPAQQEQIAQEIASLEVALLTLQQTNQTLSTQYQTIVAANITQLLSELNNINAAEVWESNLKTSLTLLAQRAGSGNSVWTSTEHNTLQAIAYQCRFAGGIGVVMARAAIEQFNYDDQAMCPGYTERSSNTADLPVKLAPNPSTDFCSITFENPTTATLLVSDLDGRMIRSLDVKEASSYVLDTRDLVNGLYTVTIKDDQGQQSVNKLVILH